MKKKMLLVLLTMLIILSVCSIASASANWVYLDTNNHMKIYIDDNRMDAFENKYGQYIIDYWLATKLLPEGKRALIQWASDSETYQSWMEEIDYMVIHIKTNTETKQENQLMVYAYSSDDRLLNSEPGKINPIRSGTNSEWWNAKVAQYYLQKIEQRQPRSTNI